MKQKIIDSHKILNGWYLLHDKTVAIWEDCVINECLFKILKYLFSGREKSYQQRINGSFSNVIKNTCQKTIANKMLNNEWCINQGSSENRINGVDR